MKILVVFLSILFSSSSCKSDVNSNLNNNLAKQTSSLKQQKAYFASGCFWCVEEVFESVKGVKYAVSGYSGGTTKNPNYEDVGYGRTDHAETVEIVYNPEIITFETLVRVFFASHNPTTLNQQGPDKGTQYRSIAFYNSDNEKNTIIKIINELNNSEFNDNIITEIKQFDKFYRAEEYHQNYVKLNPNQPYVKAVSIPRFNSFKEKMPEVLK